MKKLLIILIFLQQLFGEIFSPIPTSINVDPKKVILGKKLFNDTILSIDNTVSCATCHILENYGVDGLSISLGINGKSGFRNSPSVYNSTFNFKQMWDGRANNLSDQFLLPLTSKHEMGETTQNIVKKLQNDIFYKNAFKDIYKKDLTISQVGDVLQEFQKQLLTPDSRFDLYLKGNKTILTKDEIKGFELFKSKGCASCHNGINIGGNNYQKFGYFIKPDNLNDLGRYELTNNENDKFVFKVPSLRNVEKTAPYFHSGRVNTLSEAVKIMSKAQLGIFLKDNEVEYIVSFLKTLTGKLPNDKQ